MTTVAMGSVDGPPPEPDERPVRCWTRVARRPHMFPAVLGRRLGRDVLVDYRWERILTNSGRLAYRITLGWQARPLPPRGFWRQLELAYRPKMTWREMLGLAWFWLRSRRAK